MKYSELIALLQTFPPDAEVVRPHVWEQNDEQLDEMESYEIEHKPATNQVVIG